MNHNYTLKSAYSKKKQNTSKQGPAISKCSEGRPCQQLASTFALAFAFPLASAFAFPLPSAFAFPLASGFALPLGSACTGDGKDCQLKTLGYKPSSRPKKRASSQTIFSNRIPYPEMNKCHPTMNNKPTASSLTYMKKGCGSIFSQRNKRLLA